MYLISQTQHFAKWLTELKDQKAKIAIARRIDRARLGNLGDVKSLGDSVFEMRVDIGAGYRAYYTIKGNELIILFYGGDKSTQDRDIKKAKELAREFL